MKRRVVVTGMGVIAPNGHGLDEFGKALREGRSGIRYVPRTAELHFGCQVGGIPEGFDKIKGDYFDSEDLSLLNDNVGFAVVAAIDAWRDAGFRVPAYDDDNVDWETGVIAGSGVGGMDTIADTLVPVVNQGNCRRLGSRIVELVMNSSTSAKIAGLLGLGNQVTSNSSACSTGNEAIIEGMARIRNGLATRMLAGGSEGSSPYIWAGFDAMKVLNRKFNDRPLEASRPMSASASGFVPGSGGAFLLLEELGSALARGARIYAEILGGMVNCGGHRSGGTMTAPNPEGVVRCIRGAMADADVSADQIDLISGHLTATNADPGEVKNWSVALGRGPENFPWINSTKSMIGHCLGATGAIECVGVVLQLKDGFIHPSINCEDVHPEIAPYERSIPHAKVDFPDLKIVIKAGFGFGDVNSCLVFKKWE